MRTKKLYFDSNFLSLAPRDQLLRVCNYSIEHAKSRKIYYFTKHVRHDKGSSALISCFNPSSIGRFHGMLIKIL